MTADDLPTPAERDADLRKQYRDMWRATGPPELRAHSRKAGANRSIREIANRRRRRRAKQRARQAWT
jgi:hypothetical protein